MSHVKKYILWALAIGMLLIGSLLLIGFVGLLLPLNINDPEIRQAVEVEEAKAEIRARHDRELKEELERAERLVKVKRLMAENRAHNRTIRAKELTEEMETQTRVMDRLAQDLKNAGTEEEREKLLGLARVAAKKTKDLLAEFKSLED